MSKTETKTDTPLPTPVAAEKPRADRLERLGPAPEPQEIGLAEKPVKIVMANRAFIGQTVLEAGHVIGEVRLAPGITAEQFCAAVAQGKASSRD